MAFNPETDDVVDHRWTKLNAMLSAGRHGEPFFKILIGPTVGKWLLDSGPVEEVQNPRWPSQKPCHRLTDLGHAVINRGRYAKPPNRPKLKLLEPRVKSLKNRWQ